MSDHILTSRQLPPNDELVWAYDPTDGEGSWRAVQYSHTSAVWYDLKRKAVVPGMPYTHWMPMPAESEEEKTPPKQRPAKGTDTNANEPSTGS